MELKNVKYIDPSNINIHSFERVLTDVMRERFEDFKNLAITGDTLHNLQKFNYSKLY